MDIANISIIGGLALAALTIVGNVFVTVYSKKNEYEQARFTTVMECAYKEYEHRTNLVLELHKMDNTKSINLISFFDYFIFYSRLLRVVGKRTVNEKTMKKVCIDNKILIDSFHKYNDMH